MNLKLLGRNTALSVALFAAGFSSMAQSIPASSADSGRRAIVAVDQTTIYNYINNVQNTANWAVSIGTDAQNKANDAKNAANGAQGTADDARNRAQAAQDAANAGTVVVMGTWQAYISYGNGDASSSGIVSGICIKGLDPNWIYYARFQGANPFAVSCPAGSGGFA